ncbi:hypothetical protein F2Q70_00042523 [Brassica cretica]|uniref:Uncharacterized protein n=1 Tax=Brassica cretica TaxID=69181 RepID=A0A8S9KIR4_BRACR|nr:hypothetical protein F2Q70_00042523 [Brassica cretica]
MSCLLIVSSPLTISDSKKGNLRYRQNLWNEWSLSESNAGNGSGGKIWEEDYLPSIKLPK